MGGYSRLPAAFSDCEQGQHRHCVNFISGIISSAVDLPSAVDLQVTICAFGPLTNVAFAVAIDPHFAELTQGIALMGRSATLPKRRVLIQFCLQPC